MCIIIYICIVNIQHIIIMYKRNNNAKLNMKLKDNVLQLIKENMPLRRALMDLHDIVEWTLLRWLRENHPNLTRYDSLQVTAAYLKMKVDDLICNEELKSVE